MASDAEPAKLLLPYLQRADELQKHEPLVAYYCRLYAMERGLKIPQKDRTKTTNALLISLMKQLEKDKTSIKLGPEDNLHVEGFALNVFAKADKQDRAGRADLNTAKTFYAASIFFEILNQFGEVHPDIEQKQKYAVWKAADIRKALKEGRTPQPGPPGGDKDLLSSPTNTYDLGSGEGFSASHTRGDTSSQLPPDKDLGRSESFPASNLGGDSSSQHTDRVNPHGFTEAQIPPPSFSRPDYPSNDFHQPPPEKPEISAYPQPYHHQQSYSGEQHYIPPNYQPPENPSPSYSYPNFQSYPSFQESTFPTAPSHQPYFYQGPDVTPYAHQSAPPPASNYPSAPLRYDPSNGNGTINANHVDSPAPSVASNRYDPNYLPSVEKIAEAHKQARFAVGALAFDDVSVAVDYLRRSLELLTNPSAGTH